MPGDIYGMLQGMMGRPDPAQQMADLANQQQAQSRAALGLDQYGNPLPQGQQAAPGTSAASAQAAQAGSTLQPSQQPNATKSDQSMAALQMQLARYEQNRQSFNEGLGGVFASISQPRDRGWVSQLYNDTPLNAVSLAQSDMDLLQKQQGVDQTNQILRIAQLPANDPNNALGQMARSIGMDPGALSTLIRGDPQKALTLLQQASGMTEVEKNANAATAAYKAANPNATAQDLANYKANLIAGGMGGSDLDQRQYLAEKQAATAAGQPFPDYATWKAQHAAVGAGMAAQAKDVQDFKSSAHDDFPALDQKLNDNEKLVDQLLNNIPATQQALKAPEFLTTSKLASYLPDGTPIVGQPQDVKAAAVAIQKLKATLTGESLSSVKNVRNQREFNTLGEALTAGLNPNNPDLVGALQDIKNKMINAHATAMAATGRQLTGKYVGQGDQTLLNKNDPYYNGATQDLTDLSGMSDSDAEVAYQKLPPGRAYKGPDGVIRTK